MERSVKIFAIRVIRAPDRVGMNEAEIMVLKRKLLIKQNKFRRIKMKKIVFSVLMMFGIISTGFAAEKWSTWFHFMRVGDLQYNNYSIFYDENKKSMVICHDYYTNGTNDPNATPTMSFRLYENSNPKLFANVKEVLSLCIGSINQTYTTASSMNNSAYFFFSLRYDDQIGFDTNRTILGVKLRTLRQ